MLYNKQNYKKKLITTKQQVTYNKNIETVFLIRSSAGCKKYVTRRSRVTYFLLPARERIKKHVLHGQDTVSIFIDNLHAIFNDILRKNHGTLLYCGRSAALRQ